MKGAADLSLCDYLIQQYAIEIYEEAEVELSQ
jgi:hypothetical protein